MHNSLCSALRCRSPSDVISENPEKVGYVTSGISTDCHNLKLLSYQKFADLKSTPLVMGLGKNAFASSLFLERLFFETVANRVEAFAVRN